MYDSEKVYIKRAHDLLAIERTKINYVRSFRVPVFLFFFRSWRGKMKGGECPQTREECRGEGHICAHRQTAVVRSLEAFLYAGHIAWSFSVINSGGRKCRLAYNGSEGAAAPVYCMSVCACVCASASLRVKELLAARLHGFGRCVQIGRCCRTFET